MDNNSDDSNNNDAVTSFMSHVTQIVDEKVHGGETVYQVCWRDTKEPREIIASDTPLTVQYYELSNKIRRAGNFRISNWNLKEAVKTKDVNSAIYYVFYGADEQCTVVNHDFLSVYFPTELMEFLASRLL